MKKFNPDKELKPTKYKKIKIAIPIIIAVIVSVMIGYSLANYSVYQELEIINAVVGEFSTGLNLSKDCSGQAAGKCLSQLGEDKYGNQIANDDPAQNPRYIGATPDNYVEFNGELWRIIGTFDTYVCNDNVTGTQDGYKTNSACKTEKLLKIIKSDFLSTSMAWNTNKVNDWSKATLQTALNGDYFKRTGTYSSNGLNPTAQSMVANVVWTLGGPGSEYSSSQGTAQYYYNKERSNTVPSGNAKAFVGKVGLMFPSDYGYATGGSTSTTRATCLAKEMFSWDSLSDCYNNDWLFNSKYSQWTLSPHTGYSGDMFLVSSGGFVGYSPAYSTYELGVRPVVYLKSDVQITGGAGKEDNPYKLGYPRNAVEVVEGITDANQIAKDDPNSNPRYIGADPSNYVTFNDETWRIIGVFNTYVCNDGTSGVMDDYKSNTACKQKKVLKIIKSEFLSASIAWDSSSINDWSTSTLQAALNGDYYNKSNSYSSNGLNPTAQGMVANVVWTLGGTAKYTSASNGLASHFYGYERGETVPSGNPKAFVGKVGLMFPSDYGYATGGGTTYNRATCLAKEMFNWDSGSYKTDCAGGSWLYNSSTIQWTLSPSSGGSGDVFYVGHRGFVGNTGAYTTYGVRPVVYLNSDVNIMGGTGESGDPYQLSYTPPPPTIDEVIAAKANPSQIATDDSDNNLRYIGQNPNNYVKFNDEDWRIIGVFNTYVCDDGTTGKLDDYKTNQNCTTEKLLKIIKSDFLSTSLAWDTNNENDWSNASLQKALNGDYYNRSNSYSSNGLKDTAKNMVANVVWTLGGTSDVMPSTAEMFYTAERGTTVPSGRPKAFVGHVGLMFPSDYGYATGGGTSMTRATCLAKEIYNWSGSSECYNNDWLFNSSYSQCTLSPNSDDSYQVFNVFNNGQIHGGLSTFKANGVRPVVYLKSSVQIAEDGNDGSSTKPYNLVF